MTELEEVQEPAPSTTVDRQEHLTACVWAEANRRLVAKAIAEFSHERLLAPEQADEQRLFRITSDDGGTGYRFEATRRALDHWDIAGDSIQRRRDGQNLEPDALDFMLEFRGQLGIAEDVLPVYLEEISSTLAGAAYKLQNPAPDSAALARAGGTPAAAAQRIERAMAEGHPCFVANNGRLGFGAGDYRAYAPEAGAAVQLVWIAVHRSRAVFTSSRTLGEAELYRSELGPQMLDGFAAQLASQGLEARDYLYMPVHPWQWENKLSITFAAEVAHRNVVCLGVGADRYQAQQSIRTFFNLDVPQRCYVKTSLSVLNMGFMRGLSAEYMKATPAINDWLHRLVEADETLRRSGFTVLRELAAVGYHNDYYEAATTAGSPYRKMLAALWRESPAGQLREGEQLATMASLLHRDRNGVPFVSALMAQSGLSAKEWLEHYLRAYLMPLVHCLCAYDLAFMPHGENIILVLDDGVPVRVLMKDIGEEIAVIGDGIELPDEVSRIRVDVPSEEQVLTIFTDVFDSFFRFLSAILAGDGQLSEDAFWTAVANCLHQYRDASPETAEAFDRHEFFAAGFPLSCLNRLQLRNNREMLDLNDPSGSLQHAGRVANPIARFSGQAA
nr:IucA/IucC family siderophore biosynthesis protein [Arthrobacter castelli]